MKTKIIHIIGAGPAGLIAAINLERAGYHSIVYEQKPDVGSRFNGDFEGFENWSTKEDVTGFFRKIGLTINFRFEAYSDGTFFGPDRKPVTVHPQRPLFYLTERGKGSGSLDQGLKRQAMDAGVEIHFGEKISRLPDGVVIDGTGPKGSKTMAIARGITFETTHPNGYWGFIDNRIAPGGYAYLLINGGRGTLATFIFRGFQQIRMYFDRSIATISSLVDVDMYQTRVFGGYGNFDIKDTITRNNNVLYVGERAGLQDALWGFGMRYAMLSGYLAAQSIIRDTTYDDLYNLIIKPKLEVALANRWLFDHLGNAGYRYFLKKMGKTPSVTDTLYRQYQPDPFKKHISRFAKHSYLKSTREEICSGSDCDCLSCKPASSGSCNVLATINHEDFALPKAFGLRPPKKEASSCGLY